MLPWLATLLAAAPPLVLPADPPPLAPAQLLLPAHPSLPPASANDPIECGSCHPDVAAQWRTSAHAFSSFNNPVYRVAIERLRHERGAAPSRMCAACHDVALLADGGMDGAEVPADARAVAGISCTTCHSTVNVTKDGNGSLALRGDEALPSEIARATLAAHRERVINPPLRTSALCGACHRSFLDESTGNTTPFFGMDDYGGWLGSAYAGSTAERPDHVSEATCQGCHMAKEPAVLGDVAAKDGGVKSHRFLGAHTLLAAMRGDAATLARVRQFLADTVRVELAAARTAGGDWVMPASRVAPKPGEPLELDVVLTNEAVGHRFPGGTLDAQGTVVRVTLRTARGALVAAPVIHPLRSEVVDAQGVPLHERQTHQFKAAVWNHTIPARASRAFRVQVVPSGLLPEDLPLVVEATVEHQARLPELITASCASTREASGQAFLALTQRHMRQAIDGCVEQPVTVIARAVSRLDGKGALDWALAYRRGLALSVGLQEYLGEAADSFEAARAVAPPKDADAAVRLAWGQGLVAGKRGQTDVALRWLAQAEAQDVAGRARAALAKTRGDALAQVWRWTEAAQAYAAAAALAPEDVTVWQALAIAQASAGNVQEALAAAQRGLALHPRDADCLRVQALALTSLPADDAARARALQTALDWRVPDDGPRAKALCSKNVPGCADLRNPVPRYVASPPAVR